MALLGIILSLALSNACQGAQIQNLSQMIEDLNLRPYFELEPTKKIKVAILDNGFKGAASAIGSELPYFTKLHSARTPMEGGEEAHGFYMAKIFWDVLSLGGSDTRFAPKELHLYPAFGYTNFKFAVEDAIRRKVDVILYSQTWEYGGNFDGKGFINTLVNKALDTGIVWINNAGNFGDTTFNSSIQNAKDNWVKLPGQNSSLEFRCQENPTGKCPLRAVLSWNSFSNSTEQGTDKDLDFVLTDDTLSIIQTSSLVQSKSKEPGSSLYPREIVTAELKPGLYFLKVKNRSDNFSSSDRLRISLSGDFIKLENFDRRESLPTPADNSRVLTVGALDSEKSSVSEKLRKPELLTNSLVSLSSTENFKGSSNSAAMVAASATVLFSLGAQKSKATLISQSRAPVLRGKGLPLSQLGFNPTGNCFQPARSHANLPGYIQQSISLGGVLVETTAGWKIITQRDPIAFLPGIRRQRANDILVNSPIGPGIFPRTMLYNLPAHTVELVELPLDQVVCSGNNPTPTSIGPSWSRRFRLQLER